MGIQELAGNTPAVISRGLDSSLTVLQDTGSAAPAIADWLRSPIVLTLLALLLVWVAYRVGCIVGGARAKRRGVEGSRRALAGKTAEQWAPYLDGFPGLPSEARFLGAPIDFVVFRGLGRGEVEEIVLVEVKGGSGRLTPVERSIRDCVSEGRIAWEEHRVALPVE